MIFFNIQQARNMLVKEGLVYTLRSEFRKTGRTEAVMGTMRQNFLICPVEITRVIMVNQPSDLDPYLQHSGFNNVDTWLSMAAPSARTVYKVIRIKE